MDMTNAFDLVQYRLYTVLLALFLRLFPVIFLNHFANDQCNKQYSDMFMLHNGVPQGGVLSPSTIALMLMIYLQNSDRAYTIAG